MKQQPSVLGVMHDLEASFAVGLLVQSSSIHGEGVFATTRFLAGQPVMRLGGVLLAASARYGGGVLSSTAIGVTEDIILAERSSSQRDLSDYLNHSCSPNTGFRDAITLIATTDIEVAAEVTIDYAYWEADGAWALRAPCRCGFEACRARITGADWMRPELRDRLLEYASPFIRRRLLSLEHE